jgi:predicted unusual protein kinase regulating ubiquinone biosynthesis (AarF/ABC1/UbiB family)/nucleotide-binding universal stress UspA family protein
VRPRRYALCRTKSDSGRLALQTVNRILVATDRSDTASRAVDWAANMARNFEAELLLLQVILPADDQQPETGTFEAAAVENALPGLQEMAAQLAGPKGLARVTVDADPAKAIVQVAEEESVDVVVVGNLGMSGRKKFLLGNVPNRVSHNARCTVIIVNTAPGEGGRAVPTRADLQHAALHEEEEAIQGSLLGRAARIGRVMSKYGVREVFTPDDDDSEATSRERARALRSAMEELGPTFAKLGQILSTRPDLMPPAFIEELATLQDHVTPLTEEEVVEVMEQELGVPWEDVFHSIEAEPIAAGTIAEVHRATLETGERVVVKVQRPTARRDILQDLGLLERFAEKTKHRPAFRQVFDMPAIIEHLSQSLRRELDFRQEARNIERMREVLEPYDRLDVPGVYHDFSTDRLLVMEEVQGIPIKDIPEGPERVEAARQLLESYYRQILQDGFFHADPHPGNLMWWNDRIYFLDFGMVGEVGPDIRELLLLLLLAFANNDVSFLADVTLMLAGDESRGEVDVDAFREDLGRLMSRYHDVSLREIQLGPILQEVTEISIKHDVPLPSSLALTGKALAQMQLATAQLDPDLDPFKVAGQFVLKRMTGQLRSRTSPGKLFYEAQKLRVRLGRLVEAVERMAGARPGPKLQVHFRGTERLEDTIRRAGRRLALAITAGGALLATALTAASDRVAQWVPITLGSIGGVLLVWLLLDLVRRRR